MCAGSRTHADLFEAAERPRPTFTFQCVSAKIWIHNLHSKQMAGPGPLQPQAANKESQAEVHSHWAIFTIQSEQQHEQKFDFRICVQLCKFYRHIQSVCTKQIERNKESVHFKCRQYTHEPSCTRLSTTIVVLTFLKVDFWWCHAYS